MHGGAGRILLGPGARNSRRRWPACLRYLAAAERQVHSAVPRPGSRPTRGRRTAFRSHAAAPRAHQLGQAAPSAPDGRSASAIATAAAARRSSGRARSASASRSGRGALADRRRPCESGGNERERGVHRDRPSSRFSSARAHRGIASRLYRPLPKRGDVCGQREHVAVAGEAGIPSALGAGSILLGGCDGGLGRGTSPRRPAPPARTHGLFRRATAWAVSSLVARAMSSCKPADVAAARWRPPSNSSCSTPTVARKKLTGSGWLSASMAKLAAATRADRSELNAKTGSSLRWNDSLNDTCGKKPHCPAYGARRSRLWRRGPLKCRVLRQGRLHRLLEAERSVGSRPLHRSDEDPHGDEGTWRVSSPREMARRAGFGYTWSSVTFRRPPASRDYRRPA